MCWEGGRLESPKPISNLNCHIYSQQATGNFYLFYKNKVYRLMSPTRYSLGEKFAELWLQRKQMPSHIYSISIYLYILYTPHNAQHHTHFSTPHTTPILHATPKPHGPAYTRRANNSTQSSSSNSNWSRLGQVTAWREARSYTVFYSGVQQHIFHKTPGLSAFFPGMCGIREPRASAACSTMGSGQPRLTVLKAWPSLLRRRSSWLLLNRCYCYPIVSAGVLRWGRVCPDCRISREITHSQTSVKLAIQRLSSPTSPPSPSPGENPRDQPQ